MTVSTPLGADKLLLVGFEGTEQVSELYSFRLDMVATNINAKEIKFDKLLGQEVAVAMKMQNEDPKSSEVKYRYFRGICRRLEQGNRDTDFTTFRAEIVPQFWLTTRTAQSRIFQQISVPDILKKVLSGLKVDYQLQGTFEKREYCVQYRETDFNFVSRLMEEEGIFYFFKHTADKHELVIANSPAAHPEVPGVTKVQWDVEEGRERDMFHIHEWVKRQEVRSGKYALWDHSFHRPDDNFESKKNTLGSVAVGKVTHKLETGGNEKFEIYDYPGEFAQRFDGIDKGGGAQSGEVGKISPDGTRTVELRMQAETVAGLLVEGSSNCNQFTSGHKFTLEKHFDAEGKYILTSVHHAARSGNAYRSGGDEEFVYSNSFTCIPEGLPFRPQRTTPKPCVMGAQTAVVVGPAGEEIFTDKYGRVKVQFPWDRDNKADANSSCWLRVATSWAGKNWGAIHIPRVGHEVIVQFLEGDPDAPIIIGSVYNAGAMPPYKLPDEKTKSTLKSLSSKGGGGFNEFRLEDKKGQEEIFIHAEKNKEIRIKNNLTEWVGNDAHQIIKKDQFELVEGNKNTEIKGNLLSKIDGDHGETVKGDHHSAIDGVDHLTVKGDQCIKVTGDASFKTVKNFNQEAGIKISLKSGADFHTKAGGDYAVDASGAIHIKSGKTIVIEAATQLSLKVGGNFIDISSAGISIKGTMVNINSGGAAGSGGGSSPTAPTAPEAPDPPKPANEAVKADPGQKTAPPPVRTPPPPVTFSPAALVLQAAAAAGTPFCEECARAAEEKPENEELAVITSIAWLDGAPDKEVASATQWVNLPHDAKWVDDANGVSNIDRLGQKVRYKVTFSKPGSHAFKVKAEPGDDNVDYTGPEEGRNGKFKWMKEEKSYTTDGDGTKVVESDFFTTCAGLDSFKLVAEDKENNPPVETGLLQTKRLVYVVVVKMKDMTTNVDLGTLKSEYATRGIELVELPAVEIDRMANIGPAEEDAYKRKCKTAFNGSKGKDKMPYAVAVGFTEHLAVKNASQVLELTGVQAGAGQAAAQIPVMARGLRDGDGMRTRKLWKDLVPGEGWFVSATFTPDSGGGARNIAEAKCTALPDGSSSCGTVSVDVTDLPTGTGTLRVTVNVVDRMRGGLSFTDGNLICICTKAWWQNQGAGVQSSTAVHEMGHKVGMVADGTGKLPDKVETHYTAKGHVGPHCFFDLGELDTYAAASGNKCVMFGAVGVGSPTEFCEKCTPAVRKVDLSTGWTA